MMIPADKYFPGGYSPEHPSGNVQFQVVDNGDGTGVYYEYDTDGTILFQEDVEIDTPDPPAPSGDEIIGMLSQLTSEEFQRVLLLGIAVTHPESVWALEYAVVAEDPLVGIQVVRDAAVTALEISEAGDQDG